MKPYIIAVLQPKGGTGKTTISINLASAFRREGERVLLADSDPQGSALDWSELNDGARLPVMACCRKTIASDLAAVAELYDRIVIDGASKVTDLMGSIVRLADLVLIPLKPSGFDLMATEELIELIKLAHSITGDRPRVAFIVSMQKDGTHLSRAIREQLASFGFPVLSAATSDRVAYAASTGEGLSIFDTRDQKAIAEIDALHAEIGALIEDRSHAA